MTSLDAQQKLLEHLSVNDSVSSNDISKYISSKNEIDNKDEVLSAFYGAIDELCLAGVLVRPYNKDNKEENHIYVLKKPISLYEQTLTVDGDVALKISNIVSNFSDIMQSKYVSNPLCIRQQDLIILMEIINMYAENSKEPTLEQPAKVTNQKKK